MSSTPTALCEAVCVLGFGRSGTSLVARVLNLLGVELGPAHDLLPPTENDNPRGYWEPQWMIELNDEILGLLGGTWWQPFAAEPDWQRRPELEPLRERARSRLEASYGDAPLWGWKDPRTTYTLPFWRELVPELSYVVCLRNPGDAVASMQRRPEPTLSVRTWGELWLEYTARALMQTAGERRLLVFYEDFFDDGRAEVERLARFIGIDKEPLGERVDRAVETVQGDLRHHLTSVLELAADPGVPAEARTVFLALRAAEDARRRAAGSAAETPKLAEAIDRVAPELWWVNRLGLDSRAALEAARAEAEALRGELDAAHADLTTARRERDEERESIATLQRMLDDVRAQAAARERELEERVAREAAARQAVESSASWRLTGPLRRARQYAIARRSRAPSQ